jgi:hypothetical protein
VDRHDVGDAADRDLRIVTVDDPEFVEVADDGSDAVRELAYPEQIAETVDRDTAVCQISDSGMRL